MIAASVHCCWVLEHGELLTAGDEWPSLWVMELLTIGPGLLMALNWQVLWGSRGWMIRAWTLPGRTAALWHCPRCTAPVRQVVRELALFSSSAYHLLLGWIQLKLLQKKPKSRSLGGHGEVGVPGKTRAGGGWPGPAVTLKSKIFFQRDCAAVKEVRCGSLAKNISTCLKRSTVGLKLRSRAQWQD